MKTGFVGLVGLPNSGKSTLINALVGERVGIVTSKAQTTRKNVSGILSSEEGQVIFIDAPGFVRADRGLNAFLQKETEQVVEESDALVCLLNVDHSDPQKLLSVAKFAAQTLKPLIVAFSKCDLKKTHRILYLKRLLKEEGLDTFSQISLSSHDDSAEELREKLLKIIYPLLPTSKGPLFDPSLFTTQTSRELASEIIREKCFEYLEDEIPYGLAVEVRKYDESDKKITKIHADIIVNKTGHKSIVIGKSGSKIKEIGSSARRDLENVFEQKIYLELFVKVKNNWIKSKEVLRELGYACKD